MSPSGCQGPCPDDALRLDNPEKRSATCAVGTAVLSVRRSQSLHPGEDSGRLAFLAELTQSYCDPAQTVLLLLLGDLVRAPLRSDPLDGSPSHSVSPGQGVSEAGAKLVSMVGATKRGSSPGPSRRRPKVALEDLLFGGTSTSWATEEMTSLLPGEARALYWSVGELDGDLDRRKVDLLAVLPGLLVGFRLAVEKEPIGFPGPASYRVEAHSSPTTAFEGLALDYQLFRLPEREERRGISVRIDLKRELGPWGSSISLPLARRDYDGWQEAWRAAREFGIALATELE
jgi:hypothetical protein